MRLLIAGNWKMHGLSDQLEELRSIAHYVRTSACKHDVPICLPHTLISRGAEAAAGSIAIGGEDCAAENAGPFTGNNTGRDRYHR
jgi:triosephosphate isomerase